MKVGKRDILFALLRNPCFDETILQPDMKPRGSGQSRDGEGGGGWGWGLDYKHSEEVTSLVEVTTPI